MVEKRKSKTKIAKETIAPSLSSVTISEIQEKVMTAVHNQELNKSMDSWLKQNEGRRNIGVRDLELLSSIISEYMDSFIMFGYNLEGERVVIQHYQKPKDRDAMMEFLKIVFFKYQNSRDDDD
jgi:hypothetical protein